MIPTASASCWPPSNSGCRRRREGKPPVATNATSLPNCSRSGRRQSPPSPRIRQEPLPDGQKTDRFDTQLLALFASKLQPRLVGQQTKQQRELAALVTRRRQLLDLR